MRTIPYGLALSALIVAIALSGCSLLATGATPTQGPVDLSRLPVGSKLSAEQVKEVRRDTKGELRAYETAAGEFFLIDRAMPLPDAVRADAIAELQAVSDDGDPDALYELVNTLSYQTGHKVIAVTPAVIEGDDLWITVYGYQDAWIFNTRDEAMAQAESIRLAGANPDAWEILATPKPMEAA